MSKAKTTKETSDLDNQDLLRMVLVLANRVATRCMVSGTCAKRPPSFMGGRMASGNDHMKCVECVTQWARKEAGRVRG
jgi:hypothetical protein